MPSQEACAAASFPRGVSCMKGILNALSVGLWADSSPRGVS